MTPQKPQHDATSKQKYISVRFPAGLLHVDTAPGFRKVPAQQSAAAVLLDSKGLATPLAAVAALPASPPQQQPGSYTIHPAALDASTHTAAVFSTLSEARDQSDAAVTRIPVALAAYSTAPGQPLREGGKQAWCSGALEAVQPGGSVVTGFGLAAATTACLSGFVAKVCGPSQLHRCLTLLLLPGVLKLSETGFCALWYQQWAPGPQVIKAPAPQPDAQLQYEVVWQAEATAAPGTPAHHRCLQPGDVSWTVCPDFTSQLTSECHVISFA